MSSYWQKRIVKAQNTVADKSINSINKQIAKYYQKAVKSTLDDMENLYYRLIAKQENDTPILASDIYRMDKYWQTMNELSLRLRKLGYIQISLMEREFKDTYNKVYESIPNLPKIESDTMWTFINKDRATECINQIWCSDNLSWSKRVWGNIEKLQETLNDEFVNCIVTGKKTTYLKQSLQERFGVSYNQANRLVRTEITHIQTQSAMDRYKDAGVEEYEILVADDERMCEVCGGMDGRRYRIDEMVVGKTAPPFH